MNKLRNNKVLKPTSLWQKQTYALPSLTTSFLIGPMAIIQGMYAKYFGLPLTTIASVLLIARIFDAVTDPLIGFYADRYHARTGSRKPFILCGGLLLVLSSYFLYVPVDLKMLQTLDENTVSVVVSTGYFLGWFMVFYLAWTLFEIPHLAWANELAGSSQEKTRIYSMRSASGFLGILLFYAVPLLPFFPTNEFTPQTLSFAVMCAGCLMLLLLFICIKYTPNGVQKKSIESISPRVKKTHSAKLKVLWHEIITNKPLLLFLIAVTFSTVAFGGMWFTLIFIYVDSYLELGDKFAQGSLLANVVSLLMVVAWCFVAVRLGKKISLVLGLLFSFVGIFSTSFLAPGETGFFSLLLILTLCYGVGAIALDVLLPSLLADIIDYNRWKFGSDRSATYFSLYSVTGKISVAIGGAIGLAIIGQYGFDPRAEIYTADNVAGLHLAIAWLPSGLILCSIILFLINPLTARRHALVRNRLDAQGLCAGCH